jgi:hypothetical protein
MKVLQLWPGRQKKRITLFLAQGECFRQHPQRFRSRARPESSFEVADGTRAQPASLGQLLLTHPAGKTKPANHLAKLNWLRIGHSRTFWFFVTAPHWRPES